MDPLTNNRARMPNFILSPHQQELLLAALSSNKPFLPNTQSLSDSGPLSGLDDNPLDYDYDVDANGGYDDFGDAPQGQLIENPLPDGDADIHDKRSHPDDQENDDGGGKRREGDDRSSKKPGRKPLTSEPTSKRKAQNRAAQRAFRERKEKHLKDLETKVQDLEKASEAANHENGLLRSQIDRMSVELQEYKKRLSLDGHGRPVLSQRGLLNLAGQGFGVGNPNDLNFRFEFPKFGEPPGSAALDVSNISSPSTALPPMPVHRGSSPSHTSGVSPLDKSGQNHTSPNNNSLAQNTQSFSRTDSTSTSSFSTLSTLFPQGNSSGSKSGEDSSRRQNSTGHSTSYSSPSASSNVGSNAGLSSSCGTSPEPLAQSPSAFRPSDNTLGTIGEEHRPGVSEGETPFFEKFDMSYSDANNPDPGILSKNGGSLGIFDNTNYDINGIDWLAGQNNNQFDPELFGDYREPQNNILSGALYDESFFTDAFPINDISNPLYQAPKPDLVTEIDKILKEEDDVVPAKDGKGFLKCNAMWEKIQSCPKVQSGDIDMDSLCAQLQLKAKCSGEGPVVAEKDFKEVISSILKDEA